MVSLLLKVTAVTGLALVATRLASSHAAAVRHVLLAAMFAVLLALPIAVPTAPAISIAVPIVMEENAVAEREAPLVLSNGGAASSSTRVAVAPAGPQSSRLSTSAVLVIAWLVPSLIFLQPVIAGLWQMRRLRRRGTTPWPLAQSLVDTLARESGIRRSISVLLHKTVSSPMTFGVVRPAILLPVDAPAWALQDLRRAVVHELEHVRRGDWISQCLARVVCALYWFHPLVWLAWRRLVLEAERACDDAVLRHTEPTAYADQLVVLAQRLAIDSNQRSIAMANNSDLATRVRAVLDNRQPRGRAGGFCVALVGITAAAVVFTVSGLQIVTAAQAPQMPQWQKIAGGKMSFEVASVRPSQERNFGRFLFNTDEFYRPTGGLFAASVPLRIYIEFAYKLRPSN